MMYEFVIYLYLYNIDYPPGSKSVALQLGVRLILLYLISISRLSSETFFYFDGGWWVVDGSDFLVLQIT